MPVCVLTVLSIHPPMGEFNVGTCNYVHVHLHVKTAVKFEFTLTPTFSLIWQSRFWNFHLCDFLQQHKKVDTKAQRVPGPGRE
jgi:hypothetical protein